MSFAKVVLSGEVAQEPEKRFTPNNHVVCSFSIMVPPPVSVKQDSEPFPVKVTCWRNLAEAASEQLQKGDSVLVEGKLMMNSFQTPEGIQKKIFEIDAAGLEKLSGLPSRIVPSGSEESFSSAPRSSASTATKQQQLSGVASSSSPSASSSPPAQHFSSEDLLTEDDIPF